MVVGFAAYTLQPTLRNSSGGSRRGAPPSGWISARPSDLIVGTSTGAIIGCGLATGHTPAELVELYRSHAAEIFPKRLPSRLGWNLIQQLVTRSRHLERGDRALRRVLSALFQKTTFREVWQRRGIALAIPAVNMSTYRGWVFKTPHAPTSDHRDDDTTIMEACLASSAAPLFRSLASVEHADANTCDVFADGGLWANNPVLVALVEALGMIGNNDEEITIYSLGTCGKPEGQVLGQDDLPSRPCRMEVRWRSHRSVDSCTGIRL